MVVKSCQGVVFAVEVAIIDAETTLHVVHRLRATTVEAIGDCVCGTWSGQ
jgi:hypothetical protein